MEKTLESKNIPWGFELCFNSDCQLRDKCLHYQAYLLKPAEQLSGSAVYPDAWKTGQCQRFREDKLVQKAWGFSKIYRNVPSYLRAEARRCVKRYFSSGCGPYYRYHHGENKLSPRQQQDILQILAKFGPTEGLAFDHYETDFNFV
ncbi:MAG: hypothetical protein IJ067_10250 [Prevotella sp.]|nr:hypothetical protein [Prevotella sp.]